MKLYPDDQVRANVMIGACSGAGVTIGPVVGAVVFAVSGYMGPFILSALSNGLLTLAIMATIPNSVNTPTEITAKADQTSVQESLFDLLS